MTRKAKQISSRKKEYINICLQNNVEFTKSNGFERYEFEHRALPEISLGEIDLSTVFFRKKFRLPFFIEALTGGSPGTEKFNRNLARAAEELGIGMGLGSQRAMLEVPELTYTYQIRDVAPNILLLGNIGATQLSEFASQEISAMVREIGADGLAIHLNAAQEICQPEGDTDWSNVYANIERICKNANFPIVVKETGCGLSEEIARKLASAGAAGLDIAGAGGVSMTKVESFRGSKVRAFFEWGIPTAESLRQCRKAVKIPLIASGGMRTGLECAKALAMGASLVGFALPVLKPATESYQAVVKKLEDLKKELLQTMLLIGARTIPQLRRVKIVMRDITGTIQ
jgi:isopentenyl-diphosphate delta-isomerase